MDLTRSLAFYRSMALLWRSHLPGCLQTDIVQLEKAFQLLQRPGSSWLHMKYHMIKAKFMSLSCASQDTFCSVWFCVDARLCNFPHSVARLLLALLYAQSAIFSTLLSFALPPSSMDWTAHSRRGPMLQCKSCCAVLPLPCCNIPRTKSRLYPWHNLWSSITENKNGI